MENQLKDLAQELDSSVGSILCIKESLNAMKIELGRIRDDVDNTNNTDLS